MTSFELQKIINSHRNKTICRLKKETNMTLQELADQFNVSRERIRQICAKEVYREKARSSGDWLYLLEIRTSNCLRNFYEHSDEITKERVRQDIINGTLTTKKKIRKRKLRNFGPVSMNELCEVLHIDEKEE